MATPVWSDKVSIVALTRLTNGGVVRGTFNISSLFGGYVFLRVGRLSSTAPATGVNIFVRRILFDGGASRDIPHPATLAQFQDTLTAANLTTLNGSPSHPTAAVTLTSNTGFAGNQLVCVVDSTSSPTRAEWHRTSKLVSSTLTFDRNMANTGIVSGDTITNQALVIPPVWFDGTPNSGNIEIVFDYGLEANSSPLVVEAFGQTLTSIG